MLSDAKAKDLKKSLATVAFNVGREAEQSVKWMVIHFLY